MWVRTGIVGAGGHHVGHEGVVVATDQASGRTFDIRADVALLLRRAIEGGALPGGRHQPTPLLAQRGWRAVSREAPLDQVGRTEVPWLDRARLADKLRADWERIATATAAHAQPQAHALLETLRPEAHIRDRHHTVPRFLLKRWANASEQVHVYSRIENKRRNGNIRDLAITDFYTFVDRDGRKDSRLESALGYVEDETAPILDRLLSPFGSGPLDQKGLAKLAQFASVQSVRTARQKRELELMVEWYAKTGARGRISDQDLRSIEIVPHQNDFIRGIGQRAEAMFPVIAARPLALVTLDQPLLLIGDDPVIFNVPDHPPHTPDCYLSDEEIEERCRRRRRKDRRTSGSGRKRIVHIYSTVSKGAGVALEIVMPISPRAALIWGPLHEGRFLDHFERDHLTGSDCQDFAAHANEATCNQALDWTVARPEDSSFATRNFPEVRLPLAICDGVNAASSALNTVPARLRPARLSASP